MDNSLKFSMKDKAPWLAAFGLGLANFLGCLDLTIVNTALPVIQHSLELDKLQLQWIMNALLLALTAFMVVAGKLADRYGRRRVLYIGMLLFAAASLGAGLSSNFHTLVFFRFIQGVAIAILYTAPIALIPVIFPENTGKAMGILFGVSGLGLAMGPVIGGILTSFFSWHVIFFINLPIILISFLLCFKILPESKSSDKDKVDLVGAGLLILVLPLLIFTTVNIHILGWRSMQTIGGYFLTIVLFSFFVWRERTIKFPIIDFNLFMNQRFLIGLGANFFLAFFYAVVLFFIPLHLNGIDNFSDEKIGLMLLAPTIMVAIFSPLSGGLCDRFGTRFILSLGYIFFIISAFLQMIFFNITQVDLLLVPYVFFGIGWAFILSPSLITALSSLPKDVGGVAMGTVGTLHNFGGALGLAIGSVLSYDGSMQLILGTSVFSLVLIFFGLVKTAK